MLVHVLHPAATYIQIQSNEEQGSIRAHIATLEAGDFVSVRTKQLRGPIRELIIRHHRLTYFHFGGGLYLVRGFRKRSAKTPVKEIEYAEKVYKIVTLAI